MLCADLTPVKAWNRLRGAIFDAMDKATCRPLIDWLRAVIFPSIPNTHSTLIVPKPLAPLPDALLIQHPHMMLLIHLPGIDLIINQAAVTRIAETVREVAVELRGTWLENKQVQEKQDNKGKTENFGSIIAYLLNLVQFTDAKYPPPCLGGPVEGL